jgi:hypothetical protein
VSTAIDRVDAFKFTEDDPGPFHGLDIPPTLLIPPILMMNDGNKNPIGDKEAADSKAAFLGSTTIDGLRRSTRVPLTHRVTKFNFNNKSYSDGTYKDGTVDIMVGAGQDNDHPSPINPDPYMHILGVAVLHYFNPENVGAAFAQFYSSNPGSRNLAKLVRRPP